MTNEQIDRMMDLAARFYWDCPIPFLRAWPVMISAAVACRELRRRRVNSEKTNLLR